VEGKDVIGKIVSSCNSYLQHILKKKGSILYKLANTPDDVHELPTALECRIKGVNII